MSKFDAVSLKYGFSMCCAHKSAVVCIQWLQKKHCPHFWTMPAGSFVYVSDNSREIQRFIIGYCFREIHS